MFKPPLGFFQRGGVYSLFEGACAQRAGAKWHGVIDSGWPIDTDHVDVWFCNAKYVQPSLGVRGLHVSGTRMLKL